MDLFAVTFLIGFLGLIIYYNVKAHQREGQQSRVSAKIPIRLRESESRREPEETYDWGSLTRHRDTLGVPWATEHLGNPTHEALKQMTPEFKEFLVICRRHPALYHTLKQIAEERQIALLDLVRLFDEEERKFLMLKAEESRILTDDIQSELHRNVSGTWFHVALGGVKGYNYSERLQELRGKKLELDNEITDYVVRAIG